MRDRSVRREPLASHSTSSEVSSCRTRPWASQTALLVCVAMVAGMLAVGLSPFGSPKNEVTWLGTQNGLRLGAYATILSSTSFSPGTPADSGREPACTIELSWQPADNGEGTTLLGFSTPENPLLLSLLNYHSIAILQKGAGATEGIAGTIGVPGVFVRNRPVFLTVTSGEKGSSFFVDGKLRRVFPEFRFGGDCRGRLVIGASPVAHFRSPGKLRGLAILTREIQESEAFHHYQTWAQNQYPDIPLGHDVAGLYLFNEHQGSLVHNAALLGPNLEIPDRFLLLYKPRLEPVWKEFRPGRPYWEDNLLNVAGFIPLGLIFYACALSVWSLKRPVLASLALGLAVSLTIEVGQAFLPSRSSGTTDLITNTLGTYIGVRFYRQRLIHTFTNWFLRFFVTGKPLPESVNASRSSVQAEYPAAR